MKKIFALVTVVSILGAFLIGCKKDDAAAADAGGTATTTAGATAGATGTAGATAGATTGK